MEFFLLFLFFFARESIFWFCQLTRPQNRLFKRKFKSNPFCFKEFIFWFCELAWPKNGFPFLFLEKNSFFEFAKLEIFFNNYYFWRSRFLFCELKWNSFFTHSSNHCFFTRCLAHHLWWTRWDYEQGNNKKDNEFFSFSTFTLLIVLLVFLRFKDMEDFVTPLNKVIFFSNSPLEMDFFSFTCHESVVITTTPTTITPRDDSSTTNVTIQWDLLAKK